MKFGEAINAIKPEDEVEFNINWLDYGIVREFGFDGFDFNYDDKQRYVVFELVRIPSSDSDLGYFAHYFEGELVAVSYLGTRKNRSDFWWNSEEDYLNVNKYVLSLMDIETDGYVAILNLDNEMNL